MLFQKFQDLEIIKIKKKIAKERKVIPDPPEDINGKAAVFCVMNLPSGSTRLLFYP